MAVLQCSYKGIPSQSLWRRGIIIAYSHTWCTCFTCVACESCIKKKKIQTHPWSLFLVHPKKHVIIRLPESLAHLIDVPVWQLGKPCGSIFGCLHSFSFKMFLFLGNWAPSAIYCQEKELLFVLLLHNIATRLLTSALHDSGSEDRAF